MGPLAQWFRGRNQIKTPLDLNNIASWQDTRLEECGGGWIPALTHIIGQYLPLFSAEPTKQYMTALILAHCGSLRQTMDSFPKKNIHTPICIAVGVNRPQSHWYTAECLSCPRILPKTSQSADSLRSRHCGYYSHPPPPNPTQGSRPRIYRLLCYL